MRKFLVTVAALAAVCGAGYSGFQSYVQTSVAREVDATLVGASASGLAATRGSVNFDPSSRTLVITDLAITSDAQLPFGIKIGRITATGVDTSQAGRFAADRIEIADTELSATLPMPGAPKLTYKVPNITVMGYSGPSTVLRNPDPTSVLDTWRFALEQFAALNATSVTVPSISVSLAPTDPGAAKGALGPVTYTYSDIAMRDVHDGKIASATIERLSFTGRFAGPQGSMPITGDLAKLALSNFDAGATRALLDPAQAKDDTYHRAYGRVSAGTYTLAVGPDIKMQMDSMTIDDVGLRPSKLQIADILAMVSALPPAGGAPPSPELAQQLIGKVADIYEGIGIGRFEMKGLAVTVPQNTIKVGAVRIARFTNGRIGELAVDDLDIGGASPAKVSHFAIKGLDISGLVRVGTQLAAGGPPPTPDKLAALARLIEGVELRGFVSPDLNGKAVNVEAAEISWGAFVGPLPSKLHASLKISGPLNDKDPDPFKMLFAAGITRAAVSLDLGLGWDESAGTLALTPGAVELSRVGALSAKASLNNVARDMFSADPLDLMVSAAMVEAGPVEIVLRDTGGVDLAIAQFARQQKLTPAAAREAILANIHQGAVGMAVLNPDFTAVADALARFVETPKGTLTIRVTPKGSVPLQQILDAAKTNPMEASSLFRVEATTGK